MKRTVFLLSTIFGLIFLSSIPASASNVLNPANGPYTVGDFGSRIEKNIFSLSEKPFSLIEFGRSNLNNLENLTVDWYWQFDSQPFLAHHTRTVSRGNTYTPNQTIRLWDSLDQWDTIKRPGEWNVLTEWFNPENGTKGGSGSQLYTFTVTPEPVSTLLFLAGGVPIALRLSRKLKLA